MTNNLSPLRTYIAGYILSVVLTFVAFGGALLHARNDHVWPSHETLYAIFIILAILQLIVQLVFFLHLGREEKPRWNSISAALALFVVGVIVIGSLWIMSHLQHGTHTPYEDGMVSPAHED
jgi:cytochrome o ubiquinol oxidase operon protein cyoD